jgi:hypothetical protein
MPARREIGAEVIPKQGRVVVGGAWQGRVCVGGRGPLHVRSSPGWGGTDFQELDPCELLLLLPLLVWLLRAR